MGCTDPPRRVEGRSVHPISVLELTKNKVDWGGVVTLATLQSKCVAATAQGCSAHPSGELETGRAIQQVGKLAMWVERE